MMLFAEILRAFPPPQNQIGRRLPFPLDRVSNDVECFLNDPGRNPTFLGCVKTGLKSVAAQGKMGRSLVFVHCSRECHQVVGWLGGMACPSSL